jgi:hypothetical protein
VCWCFLHRDKHHLLLKISVHICGPFCLMNYGIGWKIPSWARQDKVLVYRFRPKWNLCAHRMTNSALIPVVLHVLLEFPWNLILITPCLRTSHCIAWNKGIGGLFSSQPDLYLSFKYMRFPYGSSSWLIQFCDALWLVEYYNTHSPFRPMREP